MSDANDEALLSRLVGALAPVPGIEAVVLGGSRARGTATAASDYDIGLYYRRHRPIDIAALSRVAALLDDRGTEAEVTPLGGWGPWIDGGGWLLVDGIHVDLLYRDLDRVASALAAALRRRFQCEASFALANARKSLGRGDVSYGAGCVFPAVASLCQVLFALNGSWLLNEKGAVAAVDGFALKPADFSRVVARLYGDLGAGKPAAALDGLEALIAETQRLWPN